MSTDVQLTLDGGEVAMGRKAKQPKPPSYMDHVRHGGCPWHRATPFCSKPVEAVATIVAADWLGVDSDDWSGPVECDSELLCREHASMLAESWLDQMWEAPASEPYERCMSTTNQDEWIRVGVAVRLLTKEVDGG